MVDLLLHDGGTGNELPGKVVDVETFQMFGIISIRFDWSWTNTVLRTTQVFQTVIYLLVSIFEQQKTPMSLDKLFPWYLHSRGTIFEKVMMDLDAWAFLPVAYDVTLNRNPA
jgi:hypothetical protein